MSDEAKFPIKVSAELTGDLPKTAEHLENIGKKGEEAGKKIQEGAEKGTKGEREIREEARGVGEAFGSQIPFIDLFTNEATAGFGAVLLGLEVLKRGLEYFSGPAERAGEDLRAIDGARLEAAATSAAALSTALQDLANKSSAMRAAFAAGDTALENSIKLYGEKRDAIVKVADAQEKAADAEIDADSSVNPLHKAANDALKEKLRLDLEDLKFGGDRAKLEFEIQQRQNQFTHAALNKDADARAIAAASGAAAGPQSDAAAAAKAVENAKKAVVAHNPLEDLHIDEAEKKLQELQEALANPLAHIGTKASKEAIADLQAQIDLYYKNVAAAQAAKDAADGVASAAAQQIKNAQATAEEHQKQSGQEAAARLVQLRAELEIQNQIAAATERASAAAASARTGAANIAANNPDKLLADATALASGIQGGTATTAADMNRLIEIVKILHDAVRDHVVTTSAGVSRIADLEREVQALQHFNANGGQTR